MVNLKVTSNPSNSNPTHPQERVLNIHEFFAKRKLMPIRGPIFVPNHYYHIYSRGNEKQNIFLNDSDRLRFLDRLSKYSKEFAITILAYCLMPNHYHLLVKQNEEKTISSFIHKVEVAYVMYFNKRYERVGHLFQGRFGAKLVETDEYLLHLSRYIHQNPLEILKSQGSIEDLANYPWSSYPAYIGKQNDDMVDTSFILAYFSKTFPHQDYQSFVEAEFSQESLKQIKDLILES